MDKLEALYWRVTFNQIKQGNEEALAFLQGENKAREKFGEPSVEDELQEYLKVLEAEEASQSEKK